MTRTGTEPDKVEKPANAAVTVAVAGTSTTSPKNVRGVLPPISSDAFAGVSSSAVKVGSGISLFTRTY